MLDDDQDMADMYLGRRQDADTGKAEQQARQSIEPPSPSHSAASMDSIDAADFMGQSEPDTEAPAHPRRPTSPGDANFIRKSTPVQAQPPPQVCLLSTLLLLLLLLQVCCSCKAAATAAALLVFSCCSSCYCSSCCCC